MIHETITSLNGITPEYVLHLADNMAAAASSFNQHSYDTFINAREQLAGVVEQLFNELGYTRTTQHDRYIE